MASTTPLFTAPCPGFGAPLDFRSPASIMAVCAYCQSTAIRQGDSLTTQGEISAILDDLSPLQLGVTGNYLGNSFTLLGRLKLEYDDGYWYEWYAAFDDGSEGWLSEASGQYVFTLPQPAQATTPQFEQLRAGQILHWEKQAYQASDVRTARCTGGEGELPFVVGKGWEARVADFRAGDRFLTLDYSEFGDTANSGSQDQPHCFAGWAVTLQSLKCQNLRDAEDIARAQLAKPSSAATGSVQSLGCPNCGSPIQYVNGLTPQLNCPACQAEIALEGPTAKLLAVNQKITQRSTLKLGDIASVAGKKWTLIGFIKVRDFDEDEPSLWTEYLLYESTSGFRWLVETIDQWFQVEVLNAFPESADSDQVSYAGSTLSRKWTYQAEVLFAAGAFNWRVKQHDRYTISEYEGGFSPEGSFGLSREVYPNEITWSLSREVTANEVMGWFGRQAAPLSNHANRPSRPVSSASDRDLAGLFKGFSIALWVINLPLILFGHGSFIATLVAWGMLWIFSHLEGSEA